MRHLLLSLLTLSSACISLEHSRAPTAKDCRDWDAQRRGWTVAGGVALACSGASGVAGAFPADTARDARLGLGITAGACAILSGFAFNQAQHRAQVYAMACSSKVPVIEPEPPESKASAKAP